MRASEHLRNLSGEDWIAATCHAFNNIAAKCILGGRKMQGHLRQDYLFIDEFARLLAPAIAYAMVEDVFCKALWLERGLLDAVLVVSPVAGERSR